MAQNNALEDKLRSLSIDRSETVVELAATQTSQPQRKPILRSVILVLLAVIAVAGTVFWDQKTATVTTFLASFAQPETPPVVAADVVPSEAAVPDAVPSQIAVEAPRRNGPAIVGSGHVIALHKLAVGAELDGRVKQITVETGQKVQQGDILVQLDDTNAQLAQDVALAEQAVAEAKLDQAMAAAEQAAAPVTRLRSLVERGAATPAELETAVLEQMLLEQAVEVSRRQVTLAKLKSAQAAAVLTLHTIRAPFDAVVVDRAAVPGQLITQMGQGAPDDTVLLTLLDTSSLFVDVDVAERNVAQVQVGTLAEVRLDAFSDRRLNANVHAIDPRASREKGTVTVRLKLEPADHEGILVNMAAKVTFTQGSDIELSALD